MRKLYGIKKFEMMYNSIMIKKIIILTLDTKIKHFFPYFWNILDKASSNLTHFQSLRQLLFNVSTVNRPISIFSLLKEKQSPYKFHFSFFFSKFQEFAFLKSKFNGKSSVCPIHFIQKGYIGHIS